MRSSDTVVAATMFVIFAVMVAAAARYPPEARLVPLVVGVPALLLSGWQLSREISKSRRSVGDATTGGKSIAWLVLFAIMVLAGGFVIGGTIAVMACQRFWLRESWRTTIASGALAFSVTYFCFERGFGLTLFQGWLAIWR